jgi:hypothetical protein
MHRHGWLGVRHVNFGCAIKLHYHLWGLCFACECDRNVETAAHKMIADQTANRFIFYSFRFALTLAQPRRYAAAIFFRAATLIVRRLRVGFPPYTAANAPERSVHLNRELAWESWLSENCHSLNI